jgi:hypothetical protein
MEDVLDESSESENNNCVCADSNSGSNCDIFASEGSSCKSCLFQDSHFPCLHTCEHYFQIPIIPSFQIHMSVK